MSRLFYNNGFVSFPILETSNGIASITEQAVVRLIAMNSLTKRVRGTLMAERPA